MRQPRKIAPKFQRVSDFLVIGLAIHIICAGLPIAIVSREFAAS